jgi:hypothetical protein
MVALVLADALLEKLGGDSMDELQAHFEETRRLEAEWPDRFGDGSAPPPARRPADFENEDGDDDGGDAA